MLESRTKNDKSLLKATSGGVENSSNSTPVQWVRTEKMRLPSKGHCLKRQTTFMKRNIEKAIVFLMDCPLLLLPTPPTLPYSFSGVMWEQKRGKRTRKWEYIKTSLIVPFILTARRFSSRVVNNHPCLGALKINQRFPRFDGNARNGFYCSLSCDKLLKHPPYCLMMVKVGNKCTQQSLPLFKTSRRFLFYCGSA